MVAQQQNPFCGAGRGWRLRWGGRAGRAGAVGGTSAHAARYPHAVLGSALLGMAWAVKPHTRGLWDFVSL